MAALMGVWAFAGRSERHLEEEEERALQLAGHRVAATVEHFGLAPGLNNPGQPGPAT
jgi:hypothetical protein